MRRRDFLLAAAAATAAAGGAPAVARSKGPSHRVTRWDTDPWSLGSYSALAVGTSWRARQVLAEPDADLEHRLLMGIEAGRDAGGQGTVDRHKPERSAALIVYSQHAYADIDLRVDLHATAIEELRRVWLECKKYEAYYRDRGRNPRGAIGQEAFMATLAPAEG